MLTQMRGGGGGGGYSRLVECLISIIRVNVHTDARARFVDSTSVEFMLSRTLLPGASSLTRPPNANSRPSGSPAAA